MIRHTRFIKTPVITDSLHLQCYQRGQWVRLEWCDRPSRLWGSNGRTVTAFHYPRAVTGFNQFAQACKSS